MSERERLVPFDRGKRQPDPARLAEFAATARKLQQERETAAGVVTHLLNETPYSEWPKLGGREELRNSGALEKLGQEAVTRRHTNPLESLAIAALATTIADALPDDLYPPIVTAQLRAHAWKDRGLALCNVARYVESLDATARAEQILAPFGTLAHDRAIVRLVRASTLQEIQRYDDALGNVRQCKQVFVDHCDDRRHLICGVIEGNILHRMGHHREAREVFISLLPQARQNSDRESLASIHNNIGYSSVEIEDFDTAEAHLHQAIVLFTELDEPLRVARAELARGRLLVRRGQIDLGVSLLRNIRERFLRHELVEEGGLCGLEIVEALLLRGSPLEAELLARRIVNEFTAAQLSTRAITALGYLSDAIAARHASAATAKHVMRYIQSLRTKPDLEFEASA
jgi:tetratricopeptide (TPR) repeat protein